MRLKGLGLKDLKELRVYGFRVRGPRVVGFAAAGSSLPRAMMLPSIGGWQLNSIVRTIEGNYDD